MKIQKEIIIFIYVRDLDYDYDDSSDEYLVCDKLIQYTRKVINIDRTCTMNSKVMKDLILWEILIKFPAKIWYPFQEDEIDIYQKSVNFEVPNC